MTRLDAIRQRLARYPNTPADWFTLADRHEHLRDDAVREWGEIQALRDLLDLVEPAQRMVSAFRALYERGVGPENHTLFRMKAYADLQTALSRLDAEIP